MAQALGLCRPADQYRAPVRRRRPDPGARRRRHGRCRQSRRRPAPSEDQDQDHAGHPFRGESACKSPNDLVQGPDGSIYFTDPTNGLTGGLNSVYKELPYTAIFRLTPDNRVELFDASLVNPNGIGLSPDGRTLYATCDNKYWMAFDVDARGRASNKRFFVDEKALGIAGGDDLKISTPRQYVD